MDDVNSRSTYNLPTDYDNDRIVLSSRDPHCLFTYWEISDIRIKTFLNEFGQELWEKSIPVLKVVNVSKNLSYYVNINDIANNWYINVEDANCLYYVEIGRRVADKFFISLESSNYILMPNDNLSTNTAAYFADYREIKKGNFNYDTAKIYNTYNLSYYYRGTFGISSLELFGMNKHESIFGPSSSEFFGFGYQNYV